ncbi:MAG TPA: DUF433 domain-containing protein [Pirellulales bacterium]|nr:DUF433 domain-containing protein [Pirellulales bacterium]
MKHESAHPSTLNNATSTNGEALAERLSVAIRLLNDSIEIDPGVLGGVPVVRGTRVSVARVLAEIADNSSISEVADNLEIDSQLLKNIVEGFSISLDQPLAE